MCNKWKVFIIVGCFLCFTAQTAYAAHPYYRMVDENGSVVYVTGWKVRVGDEFLTADNKRYQIIGIEGQTARVKFIGEVNLAAVCGSGDANGTFWSGLLKSSVAHAQEMKKVAVYHTHNDEAYVPTEGVESIDNGAGGIVKVGDVFSRSLENKGIEAIHSDTNHNPHDSMAYERSRRTVADLLKQQPDAIFDLHRDATPPEAYAGVVDGEDVTKVQFVVGKYGPTSKQAEAYAMQLKAISDEQHPGLVKGIFFAKGGDYNQDLHPKSMLVEVGAHTNSREAAERGVAMLADAVPTVLGMSSAHASSADDTSNMGTATEETSGSMKSIGWILGFLVVGSLAFLFLSTGSMREAKAKVKNFTGKEFKDVLDSTPKKSDSSEKRSDDGSDRV